MSYRMKRPIVGVDEKKAIYKDGRVTKRYYEHANKKDRGRLGKYAKHFYALYNNRCSYCGYLYTSTSDSFAIEHVIEHNDDESVKQDLENLVLSCNFCNQNKRKIGSLDSKLHPDRELEKYFSRDNKFKVIINKGYIEDADIIQMHEHMYNRDKIQYRYAIEKYENILKERNLSEEEEEIVHRTLSLLKGCR